MRSLNNPRDRAAVLERLRRLRPDTPRRWGRMTAPQMVCHLTDSFRGVLGEHPSTWVGPVVPAWKQRVFRIIALLLPVPWPRGTLTRPDIDQERGGTPPGDFDIDVAELTRACERFAAQREVRPPHFFFGRLSQQEWGRWGYRHMDHHLRQFGV